MSVLVGLPGRLVTDSLDSAPVPYHGPKAWRMHGYLIGVAGSCNRHDQRLERDSTLWPVKPTTRSLRAAVAAWPEKAGVDSEWIVVTGDRVWTIESEGYVYPRKFPCGLGCGAPWALGRMAADPDPVAAVALACEHDPYCGGRIRDLRIRPLTAR